MVSNKCFNDSKINSQLYYVYQIKISSKPTYAYRNVVKMAFSRRKTFHLDFFHLFSENVLMCSAERKPLSIQRKIIYFLILEIIDK